MTLLEITGITVGLVLGVSLLIWFPIWWLAGRMGIARSIWEV